MFDDVAYMLAQEQPPAGPSETREGQPAGGNGGGDGGDGGGTGGGGGGTGFDPTFMFLILGMFVLMMIFTTGSQRKERKRRAAMIASMDKGDRVITRGGMIGTIVELRDNEVTLKVDENANTRIKFDRNAIELVMEDKKS